MPISPRTLVTFLVLSTGVPIAGNAEDDFRVEPGFTSLFNGKDLTGWRLGKVALDGKVASSDGRFVAKDGVLVVNGPGSAPGTSAPGCKGATGSR